MQRSQDNLALTLLHKYIQNIINTNQALSIKYTNENCYR